MQRANCGGVRAIRFVVAVVVVEKRAFASRHAGRNAEVKRSLAEFAVANSKCRHNLRGRVPLDPAGEIVSPRRCLACILAKGHAHASTETLFNNSILAARKRFA